MIAEVRRTAQGEDAGAMRDAMNRLQDAAQRMGQAAYQAQQPDTDGGGYTGGQPGGQRGDNGEDVVEGEFRQV